jgi:hypothetical protein
LLASVKPFYFCALPPPVAQQLKLSGVVGLGDLLEKSKFLLSDFGDGAFPVGGDQPKMPGMKCGCFKCGSKEHLMSACPDAKSVCFRCGKERLLKAVHIYLRRYSKSLGMSPLQRVDTPNMPFDEESDIGDAEEENQSATPDVGVSRQFQPGDRVL